MARDALGTALSTIFFRWFHIAQFWKLDKLHTRSVKQFKKDQLSKMIEEAQVAFHQHDPYKLFRVINQRCPKQKSKRIHLKSPAGDFYSPPVLAQVVQVIVKRRWGACSNRCLRDSPRPVPG